MTATYRTSGAISITGTTARGTLSYRGTGTPLISHPTLGLALFPHGHTPASADWESDGALVVDFYGPTGPTQLVLLPDHGYLSLLGLDLTSVLPGSAGHYDIWFGIGHDSAMLGVVAGRKVGEVTYS